jgi:hypothetical protein
MSDYHVVSLKYAMKTAPDESYDNPPPLEDNKSEFSYCLDRGVLTIHMKDHCATVEEARSIVDPFLRTWEIGHAIAAGGKRIWFEFTDAEVVDRDPPKGDGIVALAGTSRVSLSVSGTMSIVRTKYPEPIPGILATPDVQTMWHRYQMYKDGKEPLLSMAYFCLSLLEGTTGLSAGARKAMCATYNIDQIVRDKLGDIVSEGGDGKEARKFSAAVSRKPLTDLERKWVEQVVLALIRRKAEYDYAPGAKLRQIAMTDFVRL